MSTVSETAPSSVVPPNPDYPAKLDVDYPDRLSRLLIFIKGILLIPHFIALLFLGVGAFFAVIVAWFAVLFTGTYPEGVFNYLVGVQRWGARVNTYSLLLTDKYPPFSMDDDPGYPVRVQVAYPGQIARWRPLVHWLLAYPAAIAGGFIFLLAFFCVIAAWFAILFTGRYPEGLFRVVAIALRWQVRVNVYALWMTEQYPPFVWA